MIGKTSPPKFRVERLQDEINGKEYVRVEFEKTGGRGRGSVTEPMSILQEKSKLMAALSNQAADVLKSDPATVHSEVTGLVPDGAGNRFRYTGWKRSGPRWVFALGAEILGEADRGDHFDAWAKSYSGGVAGDLKTWIANVAVPSLSSRVVSAGLMFSFAAPLLHFSSLSEGMVINFAGHSSAGKSTSNKIAASIYGNPAKLPGFDVSPRAMAEQTAMSSDICRILDDTDRNTKLDPAMRMQALYEAVDVLVSGVTRSYSTVVSEQFPEFTVRSLTLTSTQEPIEDFCRSKNLARNDGHRVRLLEIPVSHGNVGGIWVGTKLSDFGVSTSLEMTKKITAAAESHYGHAGRMYLRYLVENQQALSSSVERYTIRFLAAVGECSAVEGRIASKVALGYAALRLAKKAGVLPIKKKQALQVAIHVFRDVVSSAFGKSPDLRTALTALAEAIRDKTRVPVLASTARATLTTEAFSVRGKSRVYLRPSWLAQVCGGKSQSKLVLGHLKGEGALLKGQKDTQAITVAGGKSQRFLIMDEEALLEAIQP